MQVLKDCRFLYTINYVQLRFCDDDDEWVSLFFRCDSYAFKLIFNSESYRVVAVAQVNKLYYCCVLRHLVCINADLGIKLI